MDMTCCIGERRNICGSDGGNLEWGGYHKESGGEVKLGVQKSRLE